MLDILEHLSPYEIYLVHHELCKQEERLGVDYYMLIKQGLTVDEFAHWRRLQSDERTKKFLMNKADKYGYDSLTIHDRLDLKATDF